jgi:hypothetical protein
MRGQGHPTQGSKNICLYNACKYKSPVLTTAEIFLKIKPFSFEHKRGAQRKTQLTSHQD